MDRPTCKTCPYYRPDGELETDEGIEEIGDIIGECLRLPPRAMDIGKARTATAARMFAGWFPNTCANDWCGEHPDFPAYLASLRRPSPDPTASIQAELS